MTDELLFHTDDELSEPNLQEAFGRDNISDYVQNGLSLTVDYSVPEVDIMAGKAFILAGNQEVTALPDPRTGLSLTDNATNHIYLAYDPNDASITEPATEDPIRYEVNTSGSAPTDPSLLVATVDTSNDTATEENRDPDGSFGSVEAEEANNTVVKFPADDFSTTLADAADNGQSLKLTPGLHTVSSTITYSGAGDVHIIAPPTAIVKNDGFNSALLKIDGPSDVVIEGGYWDFNGSNRTQQSSVPAEVHVNNADLFKVEGVVARENLEFCFFANSCRVVRFIGIDTDTTVGGGGADGVHVNSDSGAVEKVVVSHSTISSGDDCISCVATDHPIKNVSVSGGSLDSSVAQGVKVEIRGDAAAGTTFENVAVEGVVVSGAGGTDAVSCLNLRDDALDIKNVNIDVVVQSPSDRGVRLEEVDGFTVDARVENPGSSGIIIGNCANGVVSGSVDGGDGTGAGVKVADSEGVQTTATIRRFNDGMLVAGSGTTDCNFNGVSKDNSNWGYNEVNGADGNLVQGVFSGNSAGETNTNTNTVVGDTV